MEAEVRAARERALVPLETRVTSFKEMLREKDVSLFLPPNIISTRAHQLMSEHRILIAGVCI